MGKGVLLDHAGASGDGRVRVRDLVPAGPPQSHRTGAWHLNPLGVLERVAPHLAEYPRWARALFFTAFAFLVASVGIYAVGYTDAQRRQEAAKLSLSVTPAVVTASSAVNADELEAISDIRDPFFEELTYADVGEEGRSHFVPQQDYLDRLRSGGRVEALMGLSLQPWTGAMRPAAFDVKVVNNTSSTLFLTEAVLEVRRSAPDLRPVLVPMVLVDRFRRLTIVDYGWGAGVPAVRVRARVEAGPGGGPDDVIDLGRLTESAEVDLTPAFRRAGFDIATLRRYEAVVAPGAGSTVAVADRLLAEARRVLRPFGLDPERDVEVDVGGEISYGAGEASARRTVSFSARVPATYPTGLGDFQPPTALYRTVELATDQTEYELRVPLSQSVKPGATDRFVIPVHAERSSRHDLRVRLVYGNGSTITSVPISLDLFVPRTP